MAAEGFLEESDFQIIRRVLAGDVESYALLVRRHQERIFALVFRQVGDRPTAEELTQDAFVKAYRNLHRFAYRSQFITWLIRITLNTTNSYFASRKYKQYRRTITLDSIVERRDQSNPIATLEGELRFQKLQLAVGELSDKYREVVTLYVYEERSYQEVADILSVPIGTVSSRMNGALQVLRRKLLR